MPRNSSSPATCRQMALWVSASSSAALVKHCRRAADSKATRAAVLGILRRIYALTSLAKVEIACSGYLGVSYSHNSVRNPRLPPASGGPSLSPSPRPRAGFHCHRIEDSLMAARASFNWIDPLLLDQQLTEEERMVRDSAQQFAADKLAPRVLEAFRNEHTDPAIFREMGETGLLGATIPEAYGGSGLNYVCYGLIAREVERVDSGYRSMMSVQSSLVMVPIYEFGNEATKQKYLPKLASGEYIGCFGLTEPNH